MRSFDSAKFCELVGLHILYISGEKYGIQARGLYRNAGLACLEYTSGPQAERIRKVFIKNFKENFNSLTDKNKLSSSQIPRQIPTLWQNQIMFHYVSTFFLTIHQI